MGVLGGGSTDFANAQLPGPADEMAPVPQGLGWWVACITTLSHHHPLQTPCQALCEGRCRFMSLGPYGARRGARVPGWLGEGHVAVSCGQLRFFSLTEENCVPQP